MESGRPLRDAFAELLNDESARSAYATDPDGFLGAYGHGDLPGSLVAEAIVNFADSASPAVAEHLAPYVTAQSGAAEPSDDAPADPGFGLDLLATAPAGLELDEPLFDDTGAAPGLPAPHPGEPSSGAEPGIEGGEHAADLDFGTGADRFAMAPDHDAPLDAGADLDPAAGLHAIPDKPDADEAGFEPEAAPPTGPLELTGTEATDQPGGDDAADSPDGPDGG